MKLLSKLFDIIMTILGLWCIIIGIFGSAQEGMNLFWLAIVKATFVAIGGAIVWVFWPFPKK